MKEVRYFVATNPSELESIYRLRYEAYIQEGAIEPRADQRFADSHDEDDNAFILGIEMSGELVGSIRLHVTTPNAPYGPGMDVFPDVLGPLLDRGESFVDPTRFVVDKRVRHSTSLLPFAGLRLGSMLADHFDATYMLATVRIEHVPFYDRMCLLHPRTPPRNYPGLKKPICLCYNYMEVLREALHPKFPVFKSTRAERVSLYGPSTALPTFTGRIPIANDNASIRHSWSLATSQSVEA